jgi:hypothetical protein
MTGSSVRAASQTCAVPAPGRATQHNGRDTWPLADQSRGLLVTSDQPIMVERVRYRGDRHGSATYGSTASAFHS